MLYRLHISNYAIIDEIELHFSENLTVITGETGAGKSILVGALWLILGERADSTLLYDKDKKCVVEGDFTIGKYHLQNFFRNNDLDYSEHTILRREINPAGKSRAFINDTPVSLSLLRELGKAMVDVHSQFETMELDTTDFQLMVVDTLSNLEMQVADYRAKFKIYKAHLAELEKRRADQLNAGREFDFIQFQLNELAEVNPKEDEQPQLEQQLQELNHTEEIKRTLIQAEELLSDKEDAVILMIREILQSLNHISKFSTSIQPLFDRLNSTKIELEDIAGEIEKLNEETIYDPDRIAAITGRLDTLYSLQKKHRLNTNAKLIKLKEEFEKKLLDIRLGDERIGELETRVEHELSELKLLSSSISKARHKQAPLIEKAVTKSLGEVGMPNAKLKIDLYTLPEDDLNDRGADGLDFLFAPNKGSAFHQIGKVASGGELSRLMLCIKSLIASSASLPTIIFDEIDSGISGETAIKVSGVLKQLAANHQVICITHLAQLAARGHTHYFVYKESDESRTFTKVKLLEGEARIKAIAGMLSGEKLSPAAIENARELVNQ